jgi:uncharacterized protein YaiE (UPF0345 family)
MTDVKWPAANADLLGPTKDLLEGVAVLEGVADIKDASGTAAPKDRPFNPFSTSATPYSMQVITAGSLAFSQQAAKIVTALGGSAAILAAIKAIWFTSGSAERAAIIAGAAAVLAAVFISLAIIVRSDVQARATAQAAEYEARARIASVFLQTAGRAQPGSTPAATRKYWLRRAGSQAWLEVDHFEAGANGFIAVLADQNKTEVQAANIEMVVYASTVS